MLSLKVGEPETGRYIGQIPVAPAGDREGEAVSYRARWCGAVLVGLLEVNRDRTDVEQSERRVADFNEEALIFDGSVVNPAAHPDTGLPRAAEDFCRQSLGGSRRVGDSQAWRKSGCIAWAPACAARQGRPGKRSPWANPDKSFDCTPGTKVWILFCVS